ncbi:unnamed protein product [Amoebophrya sp. A25]|nr:unnamed protein product [Amoebophrya sp. A25]|eukprot:GSA25T00018987001.1
MRLVSMIISLSRRQVEQELLKLSLCFDFSCFPRKCCQILVFPIVTNSLTLIIPSNQMNQRLPSTLGLS